MFKTRNYVKDLVDILSSFILRVVKKWQHVPFQQCMFSFQIIELSFVFCCMQK